MNDAIEFLKKRRSIYAIGKNIELNNEEITELIEGAVKNSPTAFNSQTVRAVITFGESSDRVWDIVLNELRKIVRDDDAFLKTKEKIATFKAGFGTVLYFTETATVKKLEKDFPLYADNFADWAEQGIGGAQQAVWEVLAANGLGASLQHYNPLIDDAIRQQFDLPESWRLRAEMPFQNCIRFSRRRQEDQDTVPSSSHESGRRTGTCTGKERHRHNFRICQVCGDIACDAAILQSMYPHPFSSTGAPYFYADQAGTQSDFC